MMKLTQFPQGKEVFTMNRAKVNKDPFSNGTEYMIFEERCCNKCIKSSEPRDGGDGLTHYTNQREDGMPRCSIQRDIMTRMFCNDPIKHETIDICNNFNRHGTLCPYMKTERKKYEKKIENQTILQL